MTEVRSPELEGERKQVTVLFADVEGSMDMAEERDPEEWHRIMQRFFSILADDVRRFEGTVDKFTGDGIMAVFGAPIAHEDHARRACCAALRMLDDIAAYAAELRRAHGLNFLARIGVNSGEVVAGGIGEGGDAEYTAVGHTVGLAQRMEALAEGGRAYLTESAAALVEGFMELKDLGEFDIKGTSHPIRVFELCGVGRARSRLELARERGFSRFVGRDKEMDELAGALARARAGEGAAVGIVAEAGVGKSRLCCELAERCRAEGIEVFEAQAQAHARSIPFVPVLQMMRAYFGVADGDPERIVREKVAGRAILLDPELAEDLPLVFDFLGVPDANHPLPKLSADAYQRSLRRVVRRLLKAPNRDQPIVLVIEDLHWMDEGSAVLLRELAGAIGGTETLLLVNFRPEYSAEWGEGTPYEEIALQPLGPEDTRELLKDLAGEDPSLTGLTELIHRRTAGNPFFIEEIVRELAEAGRLEGERGAYRLVQPVEDAGVPASVQTVLAARIDRLAPPAKRLLQVASVAGSELGERSLALIAGLDEQELGALVADLLDTGFLYELELYPERVLAFRHPLTREVAYGTQLTEQRAATHAAAARVMIELNPERHDELAPFIAGHMEEGGQRLQAARWYARAAHRAGYGHPQDAMRLWQRVTELVGELEENEETVALAIGSRLRQLDYAWRIGMDSQAAQSLAEEATEMASRAGDPRSLALLRELASARAGLPHEAWAWIAAVTDANRLADESGDRDLRVALRAVATYPHLCAGDLERCTQIADEALQLAGEDRGAGAGIAVASPVAFALMMKAVVCRDRGELEQAERLFADGLRVAGQMGDLEAEGWIRANQVSLRIMQGEVEAGLATARRNCELTERLGDVFSRSLALIWLSFALLTREDHAGALETIEEADRLCGETASSGDELQPLRGAFRAEALLGVGRTAEAIEVAEWAVGVARKRGMLDFLTFALHTLGRARAAGEWEGAREALDEAAAVTVEVFGARSPWLKPIEADRQAIAAGEPLSRQPLFA